MKAAIEGCCSTHHNEKGEYEDQFGISPGYDKSRSFTMPFIP